MLTRKGWAWFALACTAVWIIWSIGMVAFATSGTRSAGDLFAVGIVSLLIPAPVLFLLYIRIRARQRHDSPR